MPTTGATPTRNGYRSSGRWTGACPGTCCWKNDATHKHASVERWLAKHPRVHIHCTPTSGSWMNLVERFFEEITRECIHEGSFGSVPQLEAASRNYIAGRNASPVRFVWHAEGVEILRKINAARLALGLEPHPLEREKAGD